MRGFKIAQAGLSHRITALEAKCRKLQDRLARLPKRVPVRAVLDEAEIVNWRPRPSTSPTPLRCSPTAPRPPSCER